MQQPSSSLSLTSFSHRISLRRLAGFLFFLTIFFLAYQLLSSSMHRSLVTALSPLSAWGLSSPGRLPRFKTEGANCRALFANNKAHHERAQEYMRTHKVQNIPDTAFANIRCLNFVADRKYVTSTMTAEEASFPIAYSLVVFKDLSQVERLFRAIYRPQNVYCFHVDIKSTPAFKAGMKQLIKCFPNAYLAPRNVNVQWGTWTVLDADLICMKELLRRDKKWKYLINLTGQEFPLRTNLELVRILRAFNGSNAMEGTVKRLNPGRAPTKSPFNVRWTKGSLHIVAKRAFFEFLFSNRKAMAIVELLRPMPFVDETLFATLNHNPQLGTPGAFLGEPETGPKYPFLPRYKNWGLFPCLSGLAVRSICIWGVRDLPHINKRSELFINKLYWNFQPLALDCLEERHWNHTRRDYGDRSATVDPPANISYYKSLIFTKLHQ